MVLSSRKGGHMPNVFDLFPAAIEYGWKFGKVKRGTVVGTVFKVEGLFSPIVSDGNKAEFHKTPDADGISYDLLLYVQSTELPTSEIGTLVASYMVSAPNGKTYEITEALPGRNQETGELEHMELMLNLTSVNAKHGQGDENE